MKSSDDGNIGGIDSPHLRKQAAAPKLQILEMGFEKEQVDLCAATLESVGDEMSVPNMLKSLADAERVAAAARSPAHAAAKAASEAAAATADEPDNVCCICLDDFETNKALYITECGHKYHFNCIKRYCEKGKELAPSCPLCRQKMKEEDAPGKSKRASQGQ